MKDSVIFFMTFVVVIFKQEMSTSTFQVTFGRGPLGINLKSCLNGYGAYVDSFYSSLLSSTSSSKSNTPYNNNSAPNTPLEHLSSDSSHIEKSAAELAGIMIGDIIMEINSESVELMELDEIKKLLLQLRYSSVTMRFKRFSLEVEASTEELDRMINDLRNRLWFKKYLKEMKLFKEEKEYDLFLKISEILYLFHCFSSSSTQNGDETMKVNFVQKVVTLFPDINEVDKESFESIASFLERKKQSLISSHVSSVLENYRLSDYHRKKLSFYYRYDSYHLNSLLSSMLFTEELRFTLSFYCLYFFLAIHEK
jgi:membrane-associated protease RseP (regulator of RpoE activity)